MARKSSAARATEDRELDVDYDERNGFLTGKAAAIQDWRFRKEQQEGDWKRLIWRLQAKKYWRSKDPERRAAIVAYRERWRKEHRARHNEICREAKRKRRKNPETWRAELDEKKARRAAERAKLRAETIYTCVVCGSFWSPVGRLPARPPKYCGQPCRAKANYVRGKKRGATWALRGDALRAATHASGKSEGGDRG